MKKLTLMIIAIVMMFPLLNAQTIPAGMKYQAVARDASGSIIQNETINLKINLKRGSSSFEKYYTEYHTVTTNSFGLFSIVIGEGEVERGLFNDVPWSEESIWMEILIKYEGESNYTKISNSKLLAVPYAFHAGTASEFVGDLSISGTDSIPLPLQSWKLRGNYGTNPFTHKLGTLDFADLVIVTSNIERIRITPLGDINMANRLTVRGDVGVNNNLRVDNDARLLNNVHMNMLGGDTYNYGNFTVENMRPTWLTGSLNVDRETNLNDNLSVFGKSELRGRLSVEGETNLNGNLNVDGPAYLNNELSVNNGSSAKFSGSISIAKAADFNDNVNIDGATNLNSGLWVNNNSSSMLSGPLSVDGITHFKNDVKVDGLLNLGGDLTLNNGTFLGNLTVNGLTNLNNGLSVNNETASILSGPLSVEGATHLKNGLKVDGPFNVSGDVTFNNGSFLGNLNVDGTVDFNNGLSVNNESESILSGSVTIGREDKVSELRIWNNVTLGGLSKAVNLEVFGSKHKFIGQTYFADPVIINHLRTNNGLICKGSSGLEVKEGPVVIKKGDLIIEEGGLNLMSGDVTFNNGKFLKSLKVMGGAYLFNMTIGKH